MSDFVSVANLALAHLGDDRIRDPDEDTHAARTVRSAWNEVRRAQLRSGEFNFSIARDGIASVDLAALPELVVFPYSNAFALPDKCLRLIEILDPYFSRSDYSVEGGYILANTLGPLYVRTVKDVEEVGRWDALFVDLFAKELAFAIADTITGDRGRKSDAFGAARAARGRATGADAIENPPLIADEDDWILAHGGGWGC